MLVQQARGAWADPRARRWLQMTRPQAIPQEATSCPETTSAPTAPRVGFLASCPWTLQPVPPSTPGHPRMLSQDSPWVQLRGRGLSEPQGAGLSPGQGTALGLQMTDGHLVVISGTHLHPQAVPDSQVSSLREGLLVSNPNPDLSRQEARNEHTDACRAGALPQ